LEKKALISIPCLLQGGTEIQTLNYSKALRSCGIAVEVICYFEHQESIVREFEKEGSVVKLLNYSRNLSKARLLFRLYKEFRNVKPEIVHVQYMAPGALPILAARLAGVKTIFATVHQPWTKSHGLISKIVLRIAALFTTKFISVSLIAETSWFGNASMFIESIPLKLQSQHFTIHNAVNVDRINRINNSANRAFIKRKFNLSSDTIIIGAISRLREEKGINILLEAFSSLTYQNKSVHLIIIGTGPDENKLKNEALRSHCKDQITFYGIAEWERSMEILSIMDILVVPSRFEGFGLTAAEAMAAGKPVIASDSTGLREVVENHKTGLLFPVGDALALKERIEILLNNHEVRLNLGVAGKRRVNELFSLELFTRKVKALYQIA